MSMIEIPLREENIMTYHGVDQSADEGNTDGKSQVRSPDSKLLLGARTLLSRIPTERATRMTSRQMGIAR